MHSHCSSLTDYRRLLNYSTPNMDVDFRTFFALSVFLHRVEKIPSVQSLVATSSVPNICEAVIALGFMRISLWGVPQSVMAFISVWMHVVLPVPLGPSVIIPTGQRTSNAKVTILFGHMGVLCIITEAISVNGVKSSM